MSDYNKYGLYALEKEPTTVMFTCPHCSSRQQLHQSFFRASSILRILDLLLISGTPSAVVLRLLADMNGLPSRLEDLEV